MPRTDFFCWLAIIAAVGLAGCGFRLAGSAELPPALAKIYLVTPNFDRAQRRALEQRLQRAGATVTAEPQAGAVELTATLRVMPDRRLVTSASSGKTIDRLTRRLDYSLAGADGAQLLERRSLIQQKDIVLDDDVLLSSKQERSSVIGDLEQALFGQLINQLRRI